MKINESFPATHSFIQYINKVDISSGTDYYHLLDMSVPEGSKDPVSFKMEPKLTYNEQYLSGEFAIKVRNLLEATRNEILFQYNTDPDQLQVITKLLRFFIDKLSGLPKSLIKLKDIFSEEDYNYPSFQKSIEEFKKHESSNFSKLSIPGYHFKKDNRDKVIIFVNKHLILIEESLEILQHIKLDPISESTLPPKISKLFKSELTEKQLLLLFYYFRRAKVLHPYASSKAIAQALNLMTGYQTEQLRKQLPGVSNEDKAFEISDRVNDIEQIISKLSAIIETFNAFKQKLV